MDTCLSTSTTNPPEDITSGATDRSGVGTTQKAVVRMVSVRWAIYSLHVAAVAYFAFLVGEVGVHGAMALLTPPPV